MKILLELRAALDGHAGIPQETRLLFRGLALLQDVEVHGLLQSSNRVIARGLPPSERATARLSEDRRVNALSRVVVSLQGGGGLGPLRGVRRAIREALATALMMAGSLIGLKQTLSRFDASRFEDFIWRMLFQRTL